MSELASGEEFIPFVIFTCTFYSSTDDIRFQCCLAFLQACNTHHVPTVVVDASPDAFLRQAMQEAGGQFVQIFPQKAEGKKGAALREAVSHASNLRGVTEDTFLCWQESEKEEMVGLWKSVFDSDIVNKSTIYPDIVVPYRERTSFQKSYPIEQYHSEQYANMYMDCVAKKYGQSLLTSNRLQLPVDWHFGPLAFRANHVHLWTSNEGELWDAQMVPVVQGLNRGLCLRSVEVVFHTPLLMKKEEEGDLEYIEKRLFQINYLVPRVKRAWESGES